MPIKLQLLLDKAHRRDESKRAVQEALAGLGMRVTKVGAATVSAEIDASDFERLFGRKFKEPHAPDDARAVGFQGPTGDSPLPIPNPVRDYVASITVSAGFIAMDSPADHSK